MEDTWRSVTVICTGIAAAAAMFVLIALVAASCVKSTTQQNTRVQQVCQEQGGSWVQGNCIQARNR